MAIVERAADVTAARGIHEQLDHRSLGFAFLVELECPVS
jgi:hypothetical protein